MMNNCIENIKKRLLENKLKAQNQNKVIIITNRRHTFKDDIDDLKDDFREAIRYTKLPWEEKRDFAWNNLKESHLLGMKFPPYRFAVSVFQGIYDTIAEKISTKIKKNEIPTRRKNAIQAVRLDELTVKEKMNSVRQKLQQRELMSSFKETSNTQMSEKKQMSEEKISVQNKPSQNSSIMYRKPPEKKFSR